MMLHRHFEEEKRKQSKPEPEEFVSELFPPDKEEPEEFPVKRPRRKKAED